MTDLNPQMIADLARVAARYPPEEWELLIEIVNDEARRNELQTVLRELAGASRARREARRSSGATRQPGRAQRVRARLEVIGEEDPERAKLRQRELLPTMSLVRAFAEAVGVKGLRSTKREQAVTELMEQIIELPSGALEGLMRNTSVHDRKLGEEYERWVGLILDRPGRSAEGSPNAPPEDLPTRE
jgi:hypothetical protein